MGYYLKKEFAGLTYNEAVMILDKVLENMQKVNVAFLKYAIMKTLLYINILYLKDLLKFQYNNI